MDENIYEKLKNKFPLQKDGSIRIIGCAGTRRLCDLLNSILTILKMYTPSELKQVKKIFIGRHGLSVKSMGVEYKKVLQGKGCSLFDGSAHLSSIPDFGHNTKIHGDSGYEKVYFDTLEKIKNFCQNNNIEMRHFTTNSFFTDQNGNSVPGSRLSIVRNVQNSNQIEILGNENRLFTKTEEKTIVPVNVNKNIDNIIKSLCFTRRGTYMHDLKLAWIMSNYDDLKKYFKQVNCNLVSLADTSKINFYTDMMFHKYNNFDLKSYQECSKSVSVSSIDQINKKIESAGLKTYDVTDFFVTNYSDSWELNKLFLANLFKGIKNLKISAIVTDPGCGHVKKSLDGYFPLGPQDGDDLMAFHAICDPKGIVFSKK